MCDGGHVVVRVAGHWQDCHSDLVVRDEGEVPRGLLPLLRADHRLGEQDHPLDRVSVGRAQNGPAAERSAGVVETQLELVVGHQEEGLLAERGVGQEAGGAGRLLYLDHLSDHEVVLRAAGQVVADQKAVPAQRVEGQLAANLAVEHQVHDGLVMGSVLS